MRLRLSEVKNGDGKRKYKMEKWSSIFRKELKTN